MVLNMMFGRRLTGGSGDSTTSSRVQQFVKAGTMINKDNMELDAATDSRLSDWRVPLIFIGNLTHLRPLAFVSSHHQFFQSALKTECAVLGDVY